MEKETKEIISRSNMEVSFEKQKKRMLEAQSVVLNFIERNVLEEEFLNLGCLLNASYYEDITIERALQKLCGYPLCIQPLKKVSKQKYHISTKTNKVYDITERKDFCSNKCYTRSKYFKDQLPTCPIWLTNKSELQNLSVLKDELANLPGQEYDMAIPISDAKQAVVEIDEFTEDSEDQPASPVTEEAAANGLAVSELSDNETCEEFERVPDCSEAINDKASWKYEKIIENLDQVNTSVTQREKAFSKGGGHQSLVDAVPEAKSAPTRKIQLIDFQPMPKVLTRPTNETGSYVLKFSRAKTKKDDPPVDARNALTNKENSSRQIASEHFKTVQATLSRWLTSDSCRFLLGDKKFQERVAEGKIILETRPLDSSAVQASFIDMIKRLDLEEQEEEDLDKKLLNSDSEPDEPKESQKVVHDIDKLRKDTERMSLNVNSFLLGKFEFVSGFDADESGGTASSQSKKTSKDFKQPCRKKKSTECAKRSKTEYEGSNIKDATNKRIDPEPVLPTIDHNSQMTLRRQIVMRNLSAIFNGALHVLELNLCHISHFKEFISTFKLTAENIILKPKEWKIMAFLLLNLIAIKEKDVAEKLAERRKNLLSSLTDENITEEDVSEYIKVLLCDT